MGSAETVAYGENTFVSVSLSELHLWGAGEGNLYDVTFSVKDGEKEIDSVDCYFGMRTTANLDSTRPVIDTSGNFHAVGFEVYDVHDYEQDYKKLEEYYSKIDEGIVPDQCERNPVYKGRQPYHGESVFLSEYGGIKWDVEAIEDGRETSWGYGDAPKTEEEVLERYKNLTETIMKNPKMCALCYTQLYDVEQERNGLMTYDKKFKFDSRFFYNVNTQTAAVEEE